MASFRNAFLVNVILLLAFAILLLAFVILLLAFVLLLLAFVKNKHLPNEKMEYFSQLLWNARAHLFDEKRTRSGTAWLPLPKKRTRSGTAWLPLQKKGTRSGTAWFPPI